MSLYKELESGKFTESGTDNGRHDESVRGTEIAST